MRIEPGPSILSEIAPNMAADGSLLGQRDGLHLSEIIHYYQTVKKGYKLGSYGQLDVWSQQAAECGWVWERLMAMLAVEQQGIWGLMYQEAWKHRRLEVERLRGRQILQAHLELDGIKMTPDGLDVTGHSPVLLEDKHTRKTSKKSGYDILTDLPLSPNDKGYDKYKGGFVDHMIGWLMQMSGYAHAWSLKLGEPVLLGRLRVFWAGGDYSYGDPARGAQGKCYLIEFTEDELRGTWKMMLDLATEMLRERIAPVPA